MNVDANLASNAGDYGTHLYFAGRLGGVFDLSGAPDKTDQTLVFGHLDVDLITFDHTYLGASTRAYGSYSATPGGATADGEDLFTVDYLQTM